VTLALYLAVALEREDFNTIKSWGQMFYNMPQAVDVQNKMKKKERRRWRIGPT